MIGYDLKGCIGSIKPYRIQNPQLRVKHSLVFDCLIIIKVNVTENPQPVLFRRASGILWTLEYPNPQHVTTGGSSNASLSDIDAARALAVTWAL